MPKLHIVIIFSLFGQVNSKLLVIRFVYRISETVLLWTSYFRCIKNTIKRMQVFLPRYMMNTGWQKIDIHWWHSKLNINYAPVCAWKNNRRIWRYNTSLRLYVMSPNNTCYSVMVSHYLVRKGGPWQQGRNRLSVIDLIGFQYSKYKILTQKYELSIIWLSVHKECWSLVGGFTNDFHS